MRYMLDTNTVSYIINENDRVLSHLSRINSDDICISSITAAELIFGIAKTPNAKRVAKRVHEFLSLVDTLSWGLNAAHAYAEIRKVSESKGKNLSALGMLIAAHSLAANCTLVTSDKAFYQLVDHLDLIDWTIYK